MWKGGENLSIQCSAWHPTAIPFILGFQGWNAHYLHTLQPALREGHTQFSRVLPVLILFKVVCVVLGFFLVLVSSAFQFLFAISPQNFKVYKILGVLLSLDLVLEKGHTWVKKKKLKKLSRSLVLVVWEVRWKWHFQSSAGWNHWISCTSLCGSFGNGVMMHPPAGRTGNVGTWSLRQQNN